MNIQQAKEEIIHTVKIYTEKDEAGNYRIPPVHQRPVLLIGPPGIGKTAVIRQAAEECGVGLVAYTITHHTRQSAVGLPVIREKEYQGRKVQVTEYTMSEIIASVYECMEKEQVREGILFIDEINCVSETLAPTMLQFLQNKTFGTPTGCPGAGSLWRREILRNTINPPRILTLSLWTGSKPFRWKLISGPGGLTRPAGEFTGRSFPIWP